ncbi:hypothetical protein VNO80_15549 [Phaseolus coccineus]|uniref:Uncharacterized protein n=1 Tax=Phaseolus coccineus TaxID=3886 RepID=A0AAN9MKF7_PHACN
MSESRPPKRPKITRFGNAVARLLVIDLLPRNFSCCDCDLDMARVATILPLEQFLFCNTVYNFLHPPLSEGLDPKN